MSFKIGRWVTSLFVGGVIAFPVYGQQEENISADQPVLLHYMEMLNEEEETLSKMLLLQLPMPEGLIWNTPEGMRKDRGRAVPLSQSWARQKDIFLINHRVFYGSSRKSVSSSFDGPKGRLSSLLSPATHYAVVLLLPPEVNWGQEEIRIFDSSLGGDQLTAEDLEQKVANWRIRIKEEDLQNTAISLNAEVRGIVSVDEAKEVKAYALVQINGITVPPSIISPNEVEKIRFGDIESVGRINIELDHEGKRIRGQGIEVGLPELPPYDAPIHILIKEFPEWIFCPSVGGNNTGLNLKSVTKPNA